MIEFKGECGHIIRARDGDEGKTVRCTYCGAEAVVVSPAGDEADVLFDQVEKTGAFDAQSTRAGRKGARKKQRGADREAAGKGPKQDLDPFAVAMKMIYVAVLIIVLAVAWKYGSRAYESVRKNMNAPGSRTPAITDATPPPVEPDRPTKGLVAARLNRQQTGAYVASVPHGGSIFHLAEWEKDAKLFDDPLADKHLETDTMLRLAPGKHTVAVAMRINHPSMMQVPGYRELRRKIESREYDDDRQMNSYFMPDGSVAMHLVKIHGLWHVARVYEVEVERGMWLGVTAMFLPREPLGALMSVLPSSTRYAFDDRAVMGELQYYEVPEADRQNVIDALRRVGKVCYQRDEETPFRLFQIEPLEGMLLSENLGF